MRNATILCALACLLLVGTAAAQPQEYVLAFPNDTSFAAPYVTGINSGARTTYGPTDVDNDGQEEVLVSDYTRGGRVYVIEAQGPDQWELVYSTPPLDSTSSTENARAIAGGDLDGDGFGEVYFLSGVGFSEFNPNIAVLPPGLYAFEYDPALDGFPDLPTSIYEFDGDLPDRWRVEQMVIFDVDQDGQQELMFGNNGADNRYDSWYILSVTGDFGSGFEVWNEELRLSSRGSEDFDPVARGGGSPYSMIPADLDGDGTYEILMHSWNVFNFALAAATGADQYNVLDAGQPNISFQAGTADHVSLFGGTWGDVNGDGDDEAFFPRYQSFGDADVTVLNWEDGENALEITQDNVALDLLEGLTNFGITSGDLTGDGRPEVIGVGNGYFGGEYEAGEPSFFVRYAEFVGAQGADPEDASNYVIRALNTGTPLDTLGFNIVYRDSAGVTTKFFETNGDAVFPSKIAYLGDADDDGNSEVAVAFQSVDDSLTVFDEVYTEAIGASSFVQTTADADFLGTENTERGIAYNPATEQLLLASRLGGGALLYALDPATGEIADTLSTAGVGGTFYPINEVSVTADGQIFATGLVLDAALNNVKLYYWADQDAEPVVIYDSLIADGGRYGDAFGVDGSGDDVRLFLSGTFNTNVAMFSFEGSDTTMVAAPMLIPVAESAARGGIAPASDSTIWINGYGTDAQLVAVSDGTVLATLPDASESMDISFVSTGNGDLVAVGPTADESFVVYDVTDPQNARVVASTSSFATGGNQFHVGGVDFGDDGETLFTLSTNNGIAAYPVTFGFERVVRERLAVEQRAYLRIYDSAVATVADERTPRTLPETVTLSANYPNPFNPTTRFAYTLPEATQVTVRVYDVMGRVVKTLVRNAEKAPGTYELTWDATNDAGQGVASGTYFYAIEHDGGRIAKPMVLVK